MEHILEPAKVLFQASEKSTLADLADWLDWLLGYMCCKMTVN